MRCIQITKPGNPDVLQPAELPIPEIKPSEVLVRVAAAGVNRPDIMQRKGIYPAPEGASPLPGLEVAGIIEAVGSDVAGLAVGDRICALANGGGYAEYVNVPAGQCLPVPEGLGMLEAASLPETFFTVWTNVFQKAKLQPGELFLVHGGTSGIGVAAIQMARAMGARVFATAGTAEKCRICESLGAERAINYREEDFVAVIKELTNRRGVDVILDMVGGDYIQKNLQCAAMDGRIVNIAYQSGMEASVKFGHMLMKRLTMMASTLRPVSGEIKAGIAAELREVIWPRLASGEIRPVIDSTFALEDAAKAHELMESSAHIGKIMLVVDASLCEQA